MQWAQYQNQDLPLSMMFLQQDIMEGEMKINKIKIKEDHLMVIISNKMILAQRE